MADSNDGGFLRGTPTTGQRGPLVVTGPNGALPVTTSNANSTATLSNVGDSATSVTVLASNANRRGAIIANDSTAVLMVKMGATASATSFTQAIPGNANGVYSYEVPFGYTGIIDGIWASDAGGNARVTEITA